MRIGVAINQSGVARGLVSDEQLREVHARLCERLDPFDVIVSCPHDDDDGCLPQAPPRSGADGRRPARRRPVGCVMIGDTGADVAAETVPVPSV